MSLVTFAAVVAGLVTAGFGIGCSYEPTVPEGAVRCDEAQRCPAGTLCTAVRERASVLLVCCRNPGCEGRLQSTGASLVQPSDSSDEPTQGLSNGGLGKDPSSDPLDPLEGQDVEPDQAPAGDPGSAEPAP